MGTMTIYSAVMKPALPEVVVSSPFCWRLAATVRAAPQQMPPAIRSRLLPGRGWAASPKSRFRRARSIKHSTSKDKNAMPDRAVLKVNGSTRSAPTLCATKAVPQMNAASSGNTV